MSRYLAEPRSILAEPLGSAEPRLKNTGLEAHKTTNTACTTHETNSILVILTFIANLAFSMLL